MIEGLRAVVFDWAGTMVDHGCRAPVMALRGLFEEQGIALSDGDIRADMGRAKRDHIRAILNQPEPRAAWRRAHGKEPGDADIDRLHAAVAPLMRRASEECAAMIAGAADIVARLRAHGVGIGSCTGYTRAMMEDILPRAAVQGYAPDVTVCAGETAEGRPSPLMLWKNLVELGAWPAAACVKVDDATVGIAEGRAAGCWTVGVAASGNGVGLDAAGLAALAPAERAARVGAAAAALTEAGADYVIETVADLWPVLERIADRRRNGETPQPD